MPQLLNLPDYATKIQDVHGIFDDFYWERDEVWTDTADAGGTHILDADGAGGILELVNDGDDNDETYRESPERFLLAADKLLEFEARVNFSEANTDDANVLIGLMDAPGADSLLDDGAGPKASYSGFCFFKVDGENRWRIESSNGASQTTHETDVTAGGGWQTLRIIARPIDSATAEVEFWIAQDGVRDFHQCREQGVNPRVPAIKHTLSLTSLTEMGIVLGVKNGGANAETLQVDYVSCFQKR